MLTFLKALTQSPDGLLHQQVDYDGSPYIPPGAPGAPAAPGSGVTVPPPAKNPYALTNAQIFGPAAINAAGGALSAYGSYQQNQQQLAQNALQFAATQQQNQYNTEKAQNAQNAAGVLGADPLGADQQFSQHNAMLAAILPGFNRGALSSAGSSGRLGNMGVSQVQYDPEMVKAMFGPDATMNSIAQRHAELNNLDANAPTPNLTASYGTQGNAPAVQANMQTYQTQLQGFNAQQKAAFETQMKSYTDQMVAQENQQNDTGGFWHTFAKIAGVVGSVAAIALTGGIAGAPLMPVLGAILGGASAGASALGNGASGGTALGSAIIGSAPGLIKAAGSK